MAEVRPMSRKHDDELLLGLAIGLEAEHVARTRHDRARFEHRVGCDTCMWLNVVMTELEARQYDGEAPYAREDTP